MPHIYQLQRKDQCNTSFHETLSVKKLLPWVSPPSIETLRSIYDPAAASWQTDIDRIGQPQSYRLLFEHQKVRSALRFCDRIPHILDCGVGTGAFSLAFLLSIEQLIKVSGIDISLPMLNHAQKILQHHCNGLDLRQGDIRALPFEINSFDAILAAHVLEYMDDLETAIREMIRVLKPGRPIIASITRRGPGQAVMSMRWKHRGYQSHQLTSIFQAAGLKNVIIFGYGTGWSRWMCLAAVGIKPG